MSLCLMLEIPSSNFYNKGEWSARGQSKKDGPFSDATHLFSVILNPNGVSDDFTNGGWGIFTDDPYQSFLLDQKVFTFIILLSEFISVMPILQVLV